MPRPNTTPIGLDDFLLESAKKNHVIGSWGFNPKVNFTKMSVEQSNVWFFEQVFNFLRSFFGIVVPDNLEITLHNASQQIVRQNLNQMTFLDELMLILKGLKVPMWVLRLNLSIVGFLRTDFDPDHPVRVHIQEPSSFVAWGGPDETGFQTFSIGYRLFSEQKITDQHGFLWSVNQPLLEKALRKWEAQSRQRIEVVRSNSDDLPLYRHGFSKPAAGRPKPRPEPKQEAPPAEDFIPDLGDLSI